MLETDVAIIGGGIIGLATAWRLQQRFPGRSVTVLEKEASVAAHQTGRNSGVLHSGIYYKPGSLKAENCKAGKLALQEFCTQHDVAFDVCGKVIVAVTEDELPRLQNIYERGQQNGVKCEIIERSRLQELEPHVAGIRAVHVPEAGIVDYPAVCVKLVEQIQAGGGQVFTNSRVRQLIHETNAVVVQAGEQELRARWVVNCGGLHSDRLTKLGGAEPQARIVPFRGEYFELKPEVQHLCKNLIYPVPDPSFPFLGVHFTRMIHGGIECGPNAVLAFAREGYTRWQINVRDLAGTLTYPGFLKLAWKHWRMGCGEMWRSFSRAAFVKALQRLMPEIRKHDLVACPAGVRAQALQSDGHLVDDFLIVEHERIINICNAPSPAATASLNIGQLVVDRLAEHADWPAAES